MSGRRKADGHTTAGQWTEIHRRQKRDQRRWEIKYETIFFVENLPDGASNNVLLKLFGTVGRLSDAYVAKKKDSAGNKFGFLRFLNVKDYNEILDKANEVRVLEAVVKVSLARFDRNHKRFSHQENIPARGFGNKDGIGKGVLFQVHSDGHRTGTGGASFYRGGPSYKDVVNNRKAEGMIRKSLRLDMEVGLLQKHWVGKAIIGDGKDVESISGVQMILKENGLQDVGVVYVGGMKIMLTFHDKKQALEFINNGKQIWEQMFESVKIWNGEELSTERVVKLNVWGIPIHLRDKEVYNGIGSLFGKVVEKSNFSWSNMDATSGCCLVLVNRWEKIDKMVNVIWKDKNFEAKVSKDGPEWKTIFKEVAGLEEGEFLHSSSEKMATATRKMDGRGTEQSEGEGVHLGNNMHGKESDFNALAIVQMGFCLRGV